ALWTAARAGRIEKVRKLLADGADIEEKGGEGTSALFEATTKGFETIARLLLEHSADVTVTDNLGRTPLHEA
ncbi:ankyrin repeat-containing domain protein, partial [Baffinella frigidus]